MAARVTVKSCVPTPWAHIGVDAVMDLSCGMRDDALISMSVLFQASTDVNTSVTTQ